MSQDKISRAIEILKLLEQHKKGLTIKELADKLNLDYDSNRTTIKRNIDSLCYITTITEEPDGRAIRYILQASKPIQYEESDILVLAQIYSILSQINGFTQHGDIPELFKKIDKQTKGNFSKIAAEYNYLSVPNVSVDSSDVTKTIHKAIKEQRKIVVKYDKLGNKSVTTHILDPYIVRLHNGSRHLLAWYNEKQAWGVFKVNRIKSIELAEKYNKIASFDADEYFSKSMGIIGGNAVRVKIKAKHHAARYFREFPWPQKSDFVIEKETSTYVIFSVTVAGTIEIRHMVQSFLPECEILEPTGLRKTILDDLNKYIRSIHNT